MSGRSAHMAPPQCRRDRGGRHRHPSAAESPNRVTSANAGRTSSTSTRVNSTHAGSVARASACRKGVGTRGGGMPLFLLSAILLPLSVAPSSAQSFCQKVTQQLSLFKCPDVPTVDTIDLTKYTGKWFEIGASAQFAFQFVGQQGGQCVLANYTDLGEDGGRRSIKVLNKALVKQGPIRQLQTLGISSSAALLSLGIRFLCQFTEGQDSVLSLLPKLKKLQLESSIRSGGGFRAGVPGLSGTPEMRRYSRQMADLQDKVEGLIASVNSVEKVTRNSMFSNRRVAKNGQVTRALFGFGNPFSVAGLVEGLRNAAPKAPFLNGGEKTEILNQLDLITGAVASISEAAEQIFGALENIQRDNAKLVLGALPAAGVLSETKADIQFQIITVNKMQKQIGTARQAINAAATSIRETAKWRAPVVYLASSAVKLFSGEISPLSLASADIIASSLLISTTTRLVGQGRNYTRHISTEGKAKQKDQAGALKVSFPMFGGNSAPYNIIKLKGDAASGYDTALVSSCQRSFTSAFLPQSSTYLLSRAPTVAQDVIDTSLAFAAEQGIFLGGDNGFIPVLQDPDLCGTVSEGLTGEGASEANKGRRRRSKGGERRRRNKRMARRRKSKRMVRRRKNKGGVNKRTKKRKD